MKHEINIYHPKSIKEAIDNIETFFECDMWYSKDAEWKEETDMIKYLRIHFKVLEEEIIRLIGIKEYNKLKLRGEGVNKK